MLKSEGKGVRRGDGLIDGRKDRRIGRRARQEEGKRPEGEERGECSRKRETRSHGAKYTDKRLEKQRWKWATTEKTKKEGGDKIREIKEARSRA